MKVTCFVSPRVNLFFAGRVLAGLYEQTNIHVTIKLARWMKYENSLGIEVNGRRLGIELSDHADFWDRDLLSWAEVYAKRSLNLDLPQPHGVRVIPFGLHCSGRSKRSMTELFAALAYALPRSRTHSLNDYYKYVVTPHWQDFEYRPDAPVDETILYQTRLWEANEAPGDENVNDERVSLLKLLKAEFNHRCIGGLVPTPYALKHYPDMVTPQATRQPQYIKWAKSAAVGIYSRGLFGSYAFKMAEFLASSKCIVSEPLQNQLNAPLNHISIFNTNEQCVAACERLLSNGRLRREHRHYSWWYYNDHVQPKAVVSRLLNSLHTDEGEIGTTQRRNKTNVVTSDVYLPVSG